MSASLVGSEMCIRDSLTPERPAVEHALRLAARSRVLEDVPRARHDREGIEDCLLYTSDAADDMQ
eukprot:8226354-Alexandrium_andersonii.AAC.1